MTDKPRYGPGWHMVANLPKNVPCKVCTKPHDPKSANGTICSNACRRQRANETAQAAYAAKREKGEPQVKHEH